MIRRSDCNLSFNFIVRLTIRPQYTNVCTLLVIKVEKKIYPNLWNDFDNYLFLMDLDNNIHSQILLNNNLQVFVLRNCKSMCELLCLSTRGLLRA